MKKEDLLAYDIVEGKLYQQYTVSPWYIYTPWLCLKYLFIHFKNTSELIPRIGIIYLCWILQPLGLTGNYLLCILVNHRLC